MSVTIAGLVWMLALVIAFFSKRPIMMLALLILSMVFQATSLIIFRGEGIGPQSIVSMTFSIWIILRKLMAFKGKIGILRRDKIGRISRISVILFTVTLALGLQKAATDEIHVENTYLRLAQLSIYMLCFALLWSRTVRFRQKEIDYVIVLTTVVVVVIGALQFLTTTNILSRNAFWDMLIYAGETENVAYYLPYYKRIFSTFMEPSYCAAFLVGAFYYLISKEKINRNMLILSLVVLAEIILTFSSTAYGAFFVTGVIYVLCSHNKRVLKLLVPVGIIIVFWLGITGALQDILSEVIFNKMDSGSAHTRGVWDRRAIAAFMENPWTGQGYKLVRGSHLYTSLLGQIGVVGTLMYGLMVVPLAVTALRMKKLNSAVLFLAGVLAAQMIAIPDIDFCIFWQGMYILVLCIRANNEEDNAIKLEGN